MRHRQQARIFHEGLVVDQLQDTARGARSPAAGRLSHSAPVGTTRPGVPSAEAAEGSSRASRRDPRAPVTGCTQGRRARLEQLRGPLGNPIREAMRAQVPRRGGKVRARALAIHHIGGAIVRWAAHPSRPSLLQQLHRAREHQCGGGVNATLRRRQGGFGTRDCRQDRFLEALWDTGRGGAAPAIVSIRVSLAIRQIPCCSKGAAQAVTRAGLGLGYHGYHRRW